MNPEPRNDNGLLIVLLMILSLSTAVFAWLSFKDPKCQHHFVDLDGIEKCIIVR